MLSAAAQLWGAGGRARAGDEARPGAGVRAKAGALWQLSALPHLPSSISQAPVSLCSESGAFHSPSTSLPDPLAPPHSLAEIPTPRGAARVTQHLPAPLEHIAMGLAGRKGTPVSRLLLFRDLAYLAFKLHHTMGPCEGWRCRKA